MGDLTEQVAGQESGGGEGDEEGGRGMVEARGGCEWNHSHLHYAQVMPYVVPYKVTNR